MTAAGLDWRTGLDRGTTGRPRGSLRNALHAFRKAPEWDGVLAHNELTHYVNTRRPTPWGLETEAWTDNDDTRACEWLQEQDIQVGCDIAFRAVQLVASEHPYHPVSDYLNGLAWDGVPRIALWLRFYLRADPNPSLEYLEAVGAKWLIAAVARAFRPGCKVDTCLILQGPQGFYKSTVFQILGGKWFADQLSNIASKDACMQLRVWIMELAEFDVALKSDPASLKAFLTRQYDHFRPPYGRRVIDLARPCIFSGTVNDDEYLQDPTGGRRFWPVSMEKMDRRSLGVLERDRDQLWAEAVVRYRSGEVWWLNDSMEAEAEQAQLERLDTDEWTEKVLDFVARCPEPAISLTDILQYCICKPLKEQNRTDKVRVGRIMRAAGWRYKLVGPHASQVRRYVRF